MATTAGSGDAALWQAAAAGEHEAFGVLFDRHAKAVYNFLLRRTTDWSLAEDLTAAVFLQAWRRRGEVVFHRDSALPWLLGVARLVLRNAARSRARYQSALGLARANVLAARLDQQAAAIALGVSVGTVKSRLHRARQRLATELAAIEPRTAAHGMEGL